MTRNDAHIATTKAYATSARNTAQDKVNAMDNAHDCFAVVAVAEVTRLRTLRARCASALVD